MNSIDYKADSSKRSVFGLSDHRGLISGNLAKIIFKQWHQPNMVQTMVIFEGHFIKNRHQPQTQEQIEFEDHFNKKASATHNIHNSTEPEITKNNINT